MLFFCMPYRVLFHDTMAYGTHHHVSNFSFQNIARETILFETRVDGRPVWHEQLADLVLLTRDAYSLNLAPVALGQRVGILLSYEEPSRSTVRLCFRVVREDGLPVSCGWQTMVCVHKDRLEPVPAPPMIERYLQPGGPECLLETLVAPSFCERLKKSPLAVKDLFSDAVVALGRAVACAEGADSLPRIRSATTLTAAPAAAAAPLAGLRPTHGGAVFTFPGQGSFSAELLKALHDGYPETRAAFAEADRLAREQWGQSFLDTVMAPAGPRRTELLKANPDVPQMGLYLAAALSARLLIARGLEPELLLGHSVGELAALAAAEVYTIEQGLELVCKRVLALRAAAPAGCMAAVSCGPDRIGALLDSFGLHTLEVAVINHARQTVLSGGGDEMARLVPHLARHGVSLTAIDSPFPFHSSRMASAVEPFRRGLASFPFRAARWPVVLGTEGVVWTQGDNLAEILSRQFVRRLDFMAIARGLGDQGWRHFVECGAGKVVGDLLHKNLAQTSDLRVQAVAPNGSDIAAGLSTVLGKTDRLSTPMPPPAAAQMPAVVPAVVPAAVPDKAATSDNELPIAIVAMGCVLPGARDTQQYWHNLMEGVGGIVDIGELDPRLARDFKAGSVDGRPRIVPDKSYSLLHGSISQIPYDPRLGAALPQADFLQLKRGPRLLALALAQALATQALAGDARVQCILGATADGFGELDEAALVENLQDIASTLAEPPATIAAFGQALERIVGTQRGEAAQRSPHRALRAVVDRLVQPRAETYLVDSACSSSLYAVNLGMKALRDGRASCVLAGGVFAPGPASSALFAQFRGLSPTGSFPLDRRADGVVFGDGAAILMLERLPDALAAGHRVLGVIRGMGLSSDGKSPSINVPRSHGQQLAIERAAAGEVGLGSLQYVEAHATATPVGDKVEIESLRTAFAKATPGATQTVGLGSVKSLLGHTGWVSGAASLIKICLAFEHGVMPRQFHFESSDPELGIEQSPFRVPTRHEPWPPGRAGAPRRAGIDGFGFGGTNAHLIVEQFDAAYHRRFERTAPAAKPAASPTLAVVGVGSLFPASAELGTERPRGHKRFVRGLLKLPKKKILLPDVTEHMDASQYLVSLAVEQIIERLPPPAWGRLRELAGVVVGLESKTERGVLANQWVFRDRLLRLFNESPGTAEMAAGEALRVLHRLYEQIEGAQPASGPYTLTGLMPNLSASRVCTLFDLNGAAMVIDRGAESLSQSLQAGTDLLTNGDCRLVFAGAVNATPAGGDESSEAVLMLALATPATAAEFGLPVLALLGRAPAQAGMGPALAPGWRGATGATELLQALDAVLAGADEALVDPAWGWQLRSARPPGATPSTATASATALDQLQRAQQQPVLKFTPVLIPTPLAATAAVVKPGTVASSPCLLVLCEAPLPTVLPTHIGGRRCVWASAAGPGLAPGVLGIDLSSDAALKASLAALATHPFDTVLAFKRFDRDQAMPDLLDGTTLLELMFAVCRHDHQRLSNAELAFVGLSMGPYRGDHPPPCSGLMAGFIKSLARELPGARLRMLHSDGHDLDAAWQQAEAELGQHDGECEVAYRQGQRHAWRLRALARLATEGEGPVAPGAVVLATGGGRGVTAVLAHALQAGWGCTVVAVGRTRCEQVPAAVLAMDDAAFRAFEQDFFKQELARDPAQRIPELKRRLAEYQAANEISRTLAHARSLPGSLEYHSVDLADAAAVDTLVARVVQRHGRVDLVLHGAGQQVSGLLTKKPLELFRRIVAAKLLGLRGIEAALRRHMGGRRVHYHLLTSAFSWMGNDGQPDYGAANEALNRAAAWRDGIDGARWSTLAWLGWAGVGMTRGSEFAALAANRRLRPLTSDEGVAIFREMVAGPPVAPVNVLMSDGEIAFYGVRTLDRLDGLAAPAPVAPPAEQTRVWHVNTRNAPFLLEHRVHGVPTLPAAFMTAIVADAATRLCPRLKIIAFRATRYSRFAKVFGERGIELRVQASVIRADGDGADGATLRVRVLSDFFHKDGRLLEKDIVHCQTEVRMARQAPLAAVSANAEVRGDVLPDPYVLPGSAVQLGGPFASTERIVVGAERRGGRYRLRDRTHRDSELGYLLPNLIMVDAFWRFGTVQWVGEHRLGVYVPEFCEEMRVHFDYTDFAAPWLEGPLRFRGTHPRAEGDVLHVDHIELCDADGRVLLAVEGGRCRRFGEVQWSPSETVAHDALV